MSEVGQKEFRRLILAFIKCGISSEQIAEDLHLTKEQMDDMLKGVPIIPGKQSTMQLADEEERHEEEMLDIQ